MKQLAIVGIWFDGYYDLWIDFLRLFNNYWPDCPFPIYIVDNSISIDKDDLGDIVSCRAITELKVINAGDDAEYSRKIQVTLNEIDADYYLLLLEDFFMFKPVNTNDVKGIIDFIRTEGIKYYQMPLKEFQNFPYLKKYKNYKDIYMISPDDEYTVSAQPSIWEKSFLRQCIGNDNYNAWIFEGVYAKSKKAHTVAFCNGCVIDNRNILNFKHGALQGKIVPPTYKYFMNNGYDFTNKREVMNERSYFKHRLKMFIKRHMPLKFQRMIKGLIKTNSVIERYDEDIQTVIRKTIGE